MIDGRIHTGCTVFHASEMRNRAVLGITAGVPAGSISASAALGHAIRGLDFTAVVGRIRSKFACEPLLTALIKFRDSRIRMPLSVRGGRGTSCVTTLGRLLSSPCRRVPE